MSWYNSSEGWLTKTETLHGSLFCPLVSSRARHVHAVLLVIKVQISFVYVSVFLSQYDNGRPTGYQIVPSLALRCMTFTDLRTY